MRILSVANVPPDPNAGAAGTVFQTNLALERLGHEVEEVWSDALPRRVRHGNLHSLLEQPRAYRDAIRSRVERTEFDVIQTSQPAAWLAAREHRQRKHSGVFVNRSHGVELRAHAIDRLWRARLGEPRHRFPMTLLSALMLRMLDRQWPAVVRAADGIVVSSSEDRDFLTDRLRAPASSVRAIPEGVPASMLESPPHPMDASRLHRLLYVGQLAFIKGPLLLARIVDRVLASIPDASFTWVLPARDHGAARSLFEDDASGRIALLDWLPQGELGSIYDGHGIFLFPSLFEGFGKAPLEAMARGMCVVASRTGGMRDFVQDGVNGLLLPVGEVGEFARAVESLVSDPGGSQRLAQAARATADEHTWDRCATRFVEFYEELLGRP